VGALGCFPFCVFEIFGATDPTKFQLSISSLVVSISNCQCESRNSSGWNPSTASSLQRKWNPAAAYEVALNKNTKIGLSGCKYREKFLRRRQETLKKDNAVFSVCCIIVSFVDIPSMYLAFKRSQYV
jgi:hypothetical protein